MRALSDPTFTRPSFAFYSAFVSFGYPDPDGVGPIAPSSVDITLYSTCGHSTPVGLVERYAQPVQPPHASFLLRSSA